MRALQPSCEQDPSQCLGDPPALISLAGAIYLAFFGIIPHCKEHRKTPHCPHSA